MKKIILIIACATLAVACDRKKEDSGNEALRTYEETMKIHDAMMGRMDEMYKLELDLKS